MGDTVNQTLLTVERVSHQCTLTTDALDRLQHPLRLGDQRVSALRFTDPRVQALLQALAGFVQLPAGFRHRDVRPVSRRCSAVRSAAQMTDDLRRLRLRSLIERVVHTHQYRLTACGQRVAFFHSKLYLRIFRPHAPVLDTTPDPLPRPLRLAFDQLDAAIEQIHQEAALAA
jgi:hypothetical protein